MQRDRALVVALISLGLAFAAYLLYANGPRGMPWFLTCWLRRFTGLYCPGCGMTRATYAMLHGRIGEAFRMNPVGMVIVPLAFLAWTYQLFGWVRGRALPGDMGLGRAGSRWLLGVVLVFWILRNVPYWPFNYLAP